MRTAIAPAVGARLVAGRQLRGTARGARRRASRPASQVCQCSGPEPCQPWRMRKRTRLSYVPMLGLGTLRRVAGEIRRDIAAAHDRDPAARGVSSVEILIELAGRPGAAGPSRRPRAARRRRPVRPARDRATCRRERSPGSRSTRPRSIGDGLFIDHGMGVVDRRDGRDRRRRHALPGRHARRHRLRHRQAPPDGAGQRHHRLGRQAARADHGRPRREDRRQLRGHHRRAAELAPSSATPATSSASTAAARGPRRRLDPPARPGRRRDPRALRSPHRAGAAPCGDRPPPARGAAGRAPGAASRSADATPPAAEPARRRGLASVPASWRSARALLRRRSPARCPAGSAPDR